MEFKKWLLNELETNVAPSVDWLKRLGANSLLSFKKNQAFIYSKKLNKIFINSRRYHGQLITDIENYNADEGEIANHIYDGWYIGDDWPKEESDGAIGRVGWEENGKIPNDEAVVAFYIKHNFQDEFAKGAVAALLKRNIVTPMSFVTLHDYVVPVSQFLGMENKQITQDEIHRGQLQVAYHLGAWPDGRRLSWQEKQAIAKELGISSRPAKKDPYQQEFERLKLVMPGTNWRTPYSDATNYEL